MRIAPLVGVLLLCSCTGRGAPAMPDHVPPGGADLAQLLIWSIAAAIFGFGLSVAAAIWLPTKKLAIASAAGFLGVLALALTVKVIQPYLGYVVAGGFLALAAVVAYAVARLNLINRLAVLFGMDAAKAVTPAQIDAVKETHASLQDAVGVQPIIARIVKKAKAARAPKVPKAI